MTIQQRFNPKDLERIKNAVKEAESKISGEIVPVFVEKSSHYTIANYRAALIGAAAIFFLIIIFDRYVPNLAVYDPVLIFTLVMLGGFIGALKSHYINLVKRLMLSQSYMDQATRKRAENAFLQEEVFNTRQRTGIMIFISFFEHEVIVMADKGISEVVDQKEWDSMVRKIIDNVKQGKIVDGIEAAILRCGEILLEKGFVITPDDVNELGDDLRIE
ncbi:MAG: TPM domain-containing protein [Cyclobacteriaceae bacterium]|jgi:putative membrane protein|nr:TPM domain-containing protein [Cyclobacteriaceae bacterium]